MAEINGSFYLTLVYYSKDICYLFEDRFEKLSLSFNAGVVIGTAFSINPVTNRIFATWSDVVALLKIMKMLEVTVL